MTLGALLAVSGVVASFYLDTPSGGTIVLLAVALFGVTLTIDTLRRRAA
jgi:zinc transport system permease protein